MESDELRFSCLTLATNVLQNHGGDYEAILSLAERFYQFSSGRFDRAPNIKKTTKPVSFGDYYRSLPELQRWSHIEKIITAMDDHDRIAILRSRQIGMSTLLAARLVWEAHLGRNCVFIGINAAQHRVITDIMQRLLKMRPLETFEVTKAGISFDGGGSAIILSRDNYLSGLQCDLIVMSEAAYVPSDQLEKVITHPGRVIVESCSKRGSPYDKFISTVRSREREFHTMVVPWWETDSALWASVRRARKAISPMQFLEEFCCLIHRADNDLISSK